MKKTVKTAKTAKTTKKPAQKAERKRTEALTLDELIQWMTVCRKTATCDSPKITTEIRKGYRRIVDALVWAKNHGYEVKEGK